MVPLQLSKASNYLGVQSLFLYIFLTVGVDYFVFFFFQAEDGIRDWSVTGVQTCALPICPKQARAHDESVTSHAADRSWPAWAASELHHCTSLPGVFCLRKRRNRCRRQRHGSPPPPAALAGPRESRRAPAIRILRRQGIGS